jgi:septal ring factor EnvC (AmiA/AmiB activator)
MVVMAHGAARAGALFACAAGALAMFLGSADAQPARTLNQVERDRSAENARARRLRTQADAARAEVNSLNARLVESGRRRAQAEAAAADAEQRLEALQLRLAAESARYPRERAAFESALIAAAFAERRVEPSAVRVGIFARAAAPALFDQQRRTAQSIAAARQLNEQISEERSVLADAQAAIDAERGELVTLVSQRRALQASLSNDAAAAERRVQRLAAEATNLRDLAARVQAASRRRTQQVPGGAAGVIPAGWVAPTTGRISRSFGVREAGGPAAQGATLSTRARAQVVSPAAGEVAYAGLFRSYGQVLILNLDGGYALVLAGMDSTRARVGDTVQAGQPIGEMGISDTPAPELYVEVRRNGQPIDPARWLNARGLAADRNVDQNG